MDPQMRSAQLQLAMGLPGRDIPLPEVQFEQHFQVPDIQLFMEGCQFLVAEHTMSLLVLLLLGLQNVLRQEHSLRTRVRRRLRLEA